MHTFLVCLQLEVRVLPASVWSAPSANVVADMLGNAAAAEALILMVDASSAPPNFEHLNQWRAAMEDAGATPSTLLLLSNKMDGLAARGADSADVEELVPAAAMGGGAAGAAAVCAAEG
ncbi:hypothetical protein EON67_09730, partial [archaeon]